MRKNRSSRLSLDRETIAALTAARGASCPQGSASTFTHGLPSCICTATGPSASVGPNCASIQPNCCETTDSCI